MPRSGGWFSGSGFGGQTSGRGPGWAAMKILWDGWYDTAEGVQGIAWNLQRDKVSFPKQHSVPALTEHWLLRQRLRKRGRTAAVSSCRGSRAGARAADRKRGCQSWPQGLQLPPSCERPWVATHVCLEAWAAWLCQASHKPGPTALGRWMTASDYGDLPQVPTMAGAPHTLRLCLMRLSLSPAQLRETCKVTAFSPLCLGGEQMLESDWKQRQTPNQSRTPGAAWVKQRRGKLPWQQQLQQIKSP